MLFDTELQQTKCPTEKCSLKTHIQLEILMICSRRTLKYVCIIAAVWHAHVQILTSSQKLLGLCGVHERQCSLRKEKYVMRTLHSSNVQADWRISNLVKASACDEAPATNAICKNDS